MPGTPIPVHGNDHTPLGGPDAIRYAVWHIALTGDRDADEPVVVEDNVFRPPITEDMDSYLLRRLELGLGVASGSGSLSVMITNETTGDPLLTADASIAAGDNYSNQSAVVDLDEGLFVTEGDILKFDITAAGDGAAKGLKAVLVFW